MALYDSPSHTGPAAVSGAISGIQFIGSHQQTYGLIPLHREDIRLLTPSSRDADFPGMSQMTYLNTAAEGIIPTAVQQALHQYASDKLLGMDGRVLHEAQWDQAKSQLAKIYGLSDDEVSICSCSSEAYNLASLALGLTSEDEVIINDLDYPAGVTPWLAARDQPVIKIWKSREGSLRIEDLISLLSNKTRLVTTSLVSFYNGYKVNLDEIASAVRQHSSALLAVDVTQALGRIAVDLRSADLIISSTHKWILASHGGGLVGVPSTRAKEFTCPAGGWFNRTNPFDADRFQHAPTKPGAASFTVGMPNYSAVYAINASLKYIQSVGVKNIQAHAQPLTEHCLKEIAKLDVELLTPQDPSSLAGIIAFNHPKADVLHRALHARNIHVMNSAGRLRIAIHGYNTSQDIETLLSTLHKELARL